MMLAIDRCLYIVFHRPRTSTTRGHRPGVWIR